MLVSATQPDRDHPLDRVRVYDGPWNRGHRGVVPSVLMWIVPNASLASQDLEGKRFGTTSVLLGWVAVPACHDNPMASQFKLYCDGSIAG